MSDEGERRALAPGERVSHYEIMGELGRGGMGVVYRARDLDLPREVALKSPWPELADEPTVLRRFRREARAASSLMHPHVVPVFEVFDERGTAFMAMELIEGRSLKRRIREDGTPPVDEILRHAEGLADALRLAHERGILHRDVNPKNVLIDAVGDARLTDFGLVRFVTSPFGSQDGTRSTTLTADGAVVGTLAYMSPEQALGREVDARSDLFSLGAVMYEMCAGRPPFDSPTGGDLLDAILHREPNAISRLNYEIPEDLERIVRKCLAKRADERYQDAVDLLADLRAVRRRLIGSADGTDPVAAAPRRWPVAAALLLTPVLGVTAWMVAQDTGSAPLTLGSARQITAGPAWEAEGAISPDGATIAYVAAGDAGPDIFVTDVRGGQPLRLTDAPAPDRSPAWLPDGSAVLFVSERGGTQGIWRVPRLGGPAASVVERGADPAVSPDGRRLAYSLPTPTGNRIAVLDLDAPGEPVVLTDAEDGLWDQREPAWSPDGSRLCYADFRNLWIVPARGGRARRLTQGDTQDLEPEWSRDGAWIYFSSNRDGSLALWRVPSGGGEPVRLTPGTGPERRASVSRDGSRLAYTTFTDDPDVVLIDRDTGGRHRMSALGVEYGARLGGDGSRLVFVSTRWGRNALWLQPLDQGQPSGVPVAVSGAGVSAGNPDLSPDGRWIVFQLVDEGDRSIALMPVSGGAHRLLTDDRGMDFQPAFSPDGTRVAFVSNREDGEHVWTMPVGDGAAAGPMTRVSGGATWDQAPAWSPDGRRLAWIGSTEDRWDVWVGSAEAASAPRRVTDGAWAHRVVWDPVDGALLVSGTWGESGLNVRRVDPRTGAAAPFEPAIEFGAMALIGDFDVSPDGRFMVFTRQDVRGDLWVSEAEPGTY